MEARALDVMVVDDQRTMRALVRESLAAMGCTRVVECEHGLEALERLKWLQTNLILSDLNMPHLDGLGLLKAVRAQPRLKAIPFIMLTSRGEVEMVRQAVALGVNNYLVKPFSVAGLRAKVEAVMGPLQ